MVRRISGSGGPKGIGETPASGSVKGVDETKAAEVGKVSSTTGKSGLQRVQGGGYRITSESREQLFQLIHDEADKMFGPDGMPASKRKTVEGAVKMVIDASIPEEDETPPKKK